MARPERIGASESTVTYRGLRDWIEQVDKIGELLKVNGAHWDREMGSITQMLTESGKGKAPAILFDEIPDYPKGYRTLYGQFSTIKRVALTLGLPLEYERKAARESDRGGRAAAHGGRDGHRARVPRAGAGDPGAGVEEAVPPVDGREAG